MKVHKSIRLQLNHCKVEQKRAYTPVLYTVGLKSTFWKTNPSVWVVLAAQGSNEEKIEYFIATFEGGFFNFLWAKKLLTFKKKYCSVLTKKLHNISLISNHSSDF